MKKLILLISMFLSIQSFATSRNTQLSKKTTSYAEGASYSYIQQDVVDLCSVSKAEESKDTYEGQVVTFCRIERNYGSYIRSDLYLENCDDIISKAKSCSPYL